MRRICINSNGESPFPPDTRITDGETGEPIDGLLGVDLSISPDATPLKASVLVLAPRVDVTVEVGEVTRRCPYCGHQSQGDRETLS